MVTLEQYLKHYRPDIMWITGPLEDGSYLWDETLPNQDEIRALIQNFNPYAPLKLKMTISPRQIRLALLGAGINPQMIDDAIAQMPEPERSYAKITWEYATVFERQHPMIKSLGEQLGLACEQIDQLFIGASKL